MFTSLPEEIERIIWKIYYSKEVLSNIKNTQFIWKTPSVNLLNKTNDIGCYQHKYSDMEKYMYSDKGIKEAVLICSYKNCGNCRFYNFPCRNLAHYSNLSNKLEGKWKIF